MTLLINLFFIDFAAQVFMLSVVAMILVISLYLSKRDIWLILSCAFLLISQSAVFLSWNSAKYGTIGNVILSAAIIIAFQRRNFNTMVRSEVNELFNSDLSKGPVITSESLQALPPVVQKWLIKSNVIGQPPIRTLCIQQKGAMRTKENGKWLSFTADQFINSVNQGFIWKATVNSGLIIPINARDKYLHGQGNMFIKGMYTLPISNSSGNEIDLGTLMRFLAEIIWCPTAALASYIRWDYLSETSAIATIHNGPMSVSGIFSFETNGDVIGFEGMRYRDVNHHYALQKWIVAVKSHRIFGSIRIADKSEVSWQTGKTTFTWLKLEISKMKFSYGRPADQVTNKETKKPGKRTSNIDSTTLSCSADV